MSDVVDFLWARIHEDEVRAHRLQTTGGESLWSATRVLAECDAKRQLLELASSYRVPGSDDEADDAYQRRSLTDTEGLAATLLSALVLPYADHPEYQEEWAS